MLKIFLPVLVVLVLVPTIIWGFPGVWALLALVPAFIIAGTIQHVRRPKHEPGTTIRPGVLVLGSLFGLGSGAIAVIFMWAAQAPSTVVIESQRLIDAPVARVWSEVSNPYRRTKWDNWVIDLEPVGDSDVVAVGSQYRTKLNLERHQPYAQQTIHELVENQRISWQIDPIGGAELENLLQTIVLEPHGNQTVVHYQLSFRVDGVLQRVAERIAMHGSAERMTEETLGKLDRVLQGLE